MTLGRWMRAASAAAAAAALLLSAAAPSSGQAGMTEQIRPNKMPWSDMQKYYEGVFVLYAPRRENKVALTFDDVPDPRYTPQVLDILKRKKVRATFFAIGTLAAKHPGLVQRMQQEGHVVGNHSFSHPDFSRLSLPAMQEQVRKTDAVLSRLLGARPRLIRPPYGEILVDQLEWSKQEGYTVVNWDVDSDDWRQLTADEVYRNVTRTLRPGSIILLHAGGGARQNLAGTVKALPRIIDWLREHNYEPVTLPELLGVPASQDQSSP